MQLNLQSLALLHRACPNLHLLAYSLPSGGQSRFPACRFACSPQGLSGMKEDGVD